MIKTSMLKNRYYTSAYPFSWPSNFSHSIKLLFALQFLILTLTTMQLAYSEVAENGCFIPGITVDLRLPKYSDGILTTESGGVITAPDLRIQAIHVEYTKKSLDDVPVHSVVAEGDVIVEYDSYVFVGDRLEYDFINRCGVITNGRTMAEPWFFSGATIFLLPNGNYTIHDGFATTSPSILPDWKISASTTTLSENNDLYCKNVKFSLWGRPVLWVPALSINLDSIFDSPIRYSVRWGSRQGHRFGMIYELFSYERWKTFLRLDYRLKRGLGGGIETHYCSYDHKTHFDSISYCARDSSIIHPGQRFRYLFQGIGDSLLLDDKVSVHLSYYKISDIDMPTDYYDRGIELETAGPTELLIRRQEDSWIANLNTRVRINNFQTLKQELPTLETSFHPFDLGNTGIINDTYFKASYLDFVYGNNQLYDHDYSSTRVELSPQFYKNCRVHEINITPEVGAVAIAYNNSPGSSSKYLALGKFGLNLNTDFYRYYSKCKHVITPYIQYDYYTAPTVSPHDHYIFDIDDGWYRLDMLRFGFIQSLYHKSECGWITRPLYLDIYANAFFDTHTFAQSVPKAYADVVFNSFSFLKHKIQTCWNFNQNVLDYYNVRTEWTVSADIAVAAEYRHRSPFDWRKADRTNFILDAYRTVNQLRHSQLSDRRDTLLFHIFYRFHPCWALQFESRSGWNRITQPSYNEFEIDLLGTLPSAINFKLSYQHKEDDDRISVYMNIGLKRPDFPSCCGIVPLLGF